jgi:hypothetical protein
MTDSESSNNTNRDELIARVALMEAMITEGRQSTARFGWIFVLWGLVDIFGMGWQMTSQHSHLVWPVTIASGFILQGIGLALRRRSGVSCNTTLRSRSISAVWSMMGLATSLYCFTALFRHSTFGAAYIAAVFMFVGLAHATSARILRWKVQGFVAAIWWAGGVACFFVPSDIYFLIIFIGEMLFGMVFFGLYSMWLERQRPSTSVPQNA